MAVALSLALLIMAASGDVTYDGSVREEVRVGSGLAVNAPSAAVSATEVVTPSVSGVWTYAGNKLSALYAPILQLPDFPNLGVRGFEVLHSARVADDFQATDSRTRLGASEEFQYGNADLFALTQVSAAAPQIQAVPTVIGLYYVYSTSLARLSSELTPRLQLELSGGYQESGGVDAAAQAQLPLQWGPLATAQLVYQLSPLDALTTALSGAEAQFSGGQEIWLTEATEGWRHRFGHELVGQLDLGWSLLSDQAQPGTPAVLYTFPVTRLSVTETHNLGRERRLVLNVSSELAPYIDRVFATGYEHFQVFGSADLTVVTGFGFGLQGGYTDPVSGNVIDSEAVTTGTGSVFYEPLKQLRFEIGGVALWQQAPGGPAVFQWITFAAVVVKDSGKL